ncbi:spore germination protein GerPC [Bacillus sp. REN10]|uniref:spore germination protein GerPC n=1 Tax=Bacillus sp. REN10 TaxID=2782541 RepID=UPI00193B08A9|nr:spore germination protein GerPC [Bacillus sp. REN10]
MIQLQDIQNLWQYIQQQQRQIDALTKKVQKLQQEMVEVKKRPPVSVDKIEYSFDQLKVETLAGTLNIGLSPSELSGIKDYAVNVKGQSVPSGQQLLPQLLHSSNRFIDENLDQLIETYEGQLQRSINPEIKEHMKQDLTKQLPERIGFYLNQCKEEPPEIVEEKVLEKIKEDIQQALLSFISKIPEME